MLPFTGRMLDKKTVKCWQNVSCLSLRLRAGENGKDFTLFRYEEIAELLPKNIARTAKVQVNG